MTSFVSLSQVVHFESAGSSDSMSLVAGSCEAREASSTSLKALDVPPDILLEIFVYLQPPNPYSTKHHSAWRKWLNFSQVCRTWRHIALADARLWTCPPLRFPRLAKEMILRARTCPLEIDLCYGTIGPKTVTDLSDVLALAFKEGSSIRTLRASRMTPSQVNRYLPSLSHSPSLEELHLGMMGELGQFLVPLIVAPQLQRIRLFNCIFPFKMQSLWYLTTLEISSWDNHPATRVSIPTLLEFIAGAPHLVHVELFHALKTAKTSNPPSNTLPASVSLPHIKTLRITDCAEPILGLISNMQLPLIDPSGKPTYAHVRHSLRDGNVWPNALRKDPVYIVVLDWGSGIFKTYISR